MPRNHTPTYKIKCFLLKIKFCYICLEVFLKQESDNRNQCQILLSDKREISIIKKVLSSLF